MSDIILRVPDAVYIRLRQAADATSQPVEEMLINHLISAFSDPLPALPPDEEAELDALNHLSDDALWTIARERLPSSVQERMADLMEHNSLGRISADERGELEGLVERADRLMLRRAEANAILRQRGHPATGQDTRPDDD